MNNTFNNIRLRRAAPKLLAVLQETERLNHVQNILPEYLLDEIKEAIAEASPIDQDALHQVSWTYFNGVIEQKSIVHVTSDGGETTLCGKGSARSGRATPAARSSVQVLCQPLQSHLRQRVSKTIN